MEGQEYIPLKRGSLRLSAFSDEDARCVEFVFWPQDGMKLPYFDYSRNNAVVLTRDWWHHVWFQLHGAPNGVLRVPRVLQSIRQLFVNRGVDRLAFASYDFTMCEEHEDAVTGIATFPYVDPSRDDVLFDIVISIFAEYWGMSAADIQVQYYGIE